MSQSITGMGAEWECRVSRAEALRLLAPHPLPRMGYETDIATKRDAFGFVFHLTVQNVSGVYVAASCSVPRAQWAEFFSVNVKGANDANH